MALSPADLRNVALIGHGHTGKTTIVDALAAITKVSSRQGDSGDGSSISNTDPEERDRKQTLMSHVFHFDMDGMRLQVIDTPGHPDFVADAIAAMQVVETAILCVSAVGGVTFHAQQLWKAAEAAGVGRAVIVTNIDNDAADWDAAVASLVKAFGDEIVPLTYPDAQGPSFKAIHDVMAGDGPRSGEYFERLMERVALADDEVLEHESISKAEVIEHMPAAIAHRKVTPVFAVCPKKGIGLRKMFDNIKHDFPSPIAVAHHRASKPGDTALDQMVEPRSEQPFMAQVFKVIADPYVGRLSYMCCVRGSCTPESTMTIARTGQAVKFGSLQQPMGKDLQPVNHVGVGDIFVVGKIEELELGDTVVEGGDPVILQTANYPSGTYSLAIEPKARGDEQKINQGLEKLCAEDPTFKFYRSTETAEQVVTGMSPIHLEVQFSRLERRYGASVTSHAPTIPYKETIQGNADGHHRHKKQSGGRGQFAEVHLRIQPRESGTGFEFLDKVVGGSIPRQFISEIEKGVAKYLEKGGVAGFRIEDVTAEVYDGKFHDVDSDQISFQIAGERAFAEAFEKAKPVLLEPIMNIEIHVPERFTGDVASSLSSHRGRLSGMEISDGIQVIQAQVPLKEMQEYSTQLRSITAGEGSFAMEPSHYEQVPPQIQAEIVAERAAVPV